MQTQVEHSAHSEAADHQSTGQEERKASDSMGVLRYAQLFNAAHGMAVSVESFVFFNWD